MIDDGITRRSVLRSVAAAGTATVATGMAAGEGGPTARIVGTASPRAERAARARAESVKRVLDFGDIGKAVAGKFTDEAAENLANRPDVRYVEEDSTYRALGEELWWGVDRIDAEVAHSNGDTGDGADIAIIDTGIDGDHPDLNANVGSGKAFVDCGSRACVGQPCSDTSNCNHSWSDDNDHGTHCAGIADAEAGNSEGVIGVSTTATLHAVKVLDCHGCGSLSDVAAGIEYVADQGWDVGSMSLGASSGDQTLKDACSYASNKGVLLVAAAGNDGPCTDCVGYPAAYSEVIAVSATGKDDALAGYSSTGPEVELAAPGGSDLDGDDSYENNEVIKSSVIGGYDYFAGTSMACPHVSGVGAMLMANDKSNTEARQQLRDTAEDLAGDGSGDKNNKFGYGLVDAAAALGYDSSDDLGGGGNSAPAVDSLSATEVETDDSDAEFDVDWSVSDTDGNLDTVDLTLTDDTDGETEDTASISVSDDTASGTTRLVAAGDDGSGNSYTVDATVTDSDGNTGSGSTSVSETESTNAAPSASIDSLDNRSNPRWDRYEVDWSAGDSDGNLDTVVVEMLDSSGNRLDSVTNDVSGSSASGVDEVRSRQNGTEIVVTATDTDGASGSDSRSV